MNCKQVRQRMLVLLVSGETNPTGELAEHLRSCRACDALFARLPAISSELQRLPDKELPPSFDETFKRRLALRMQEANRIPGSGLTYLLAKDGLGWVLFLMLGIAPIAAGLGDAADASTHPPLISASNVGVMALGLLFAAAFVQAVLHWDTITGYLKGKEI